MAVVRSGRSSNPIPIAICIFIALMSTVVAIFFYLQNEKQAAELKRKADDLKVYVAPQDRSNDDVLRLVAAGSKGKRSAVAEAADQINRLKGLIDAGGTGRSVEDLQQQFVSVREQTGARNAGSAIEAMKTLKNSQTAAEERMKSAQQESAAAKGSFDASGKDYAALKTGFDKTLKERKDELDALSAKITEKEAELVKLKEASEKEKTEVNAAMDKAIRDQLVIVQATKDELEKVRGRTKELERQLAVLRPDPKEVAVREADGRIIRANQVTGEAYISLGRKDRLMPGHTFAVYDPRLGVISGPDGGGKAKLEVIEVNESDALCRVTFLEKNQHIETNDLIANPVYARDKSRKFHFVVYGDFDLDGDGITTAAEREKLTRLIQSWGGVIDEQVSTQTDFVVMGAMPGTSTARYMSDNDPNSDLAKARKAQEEKYKGMLKEAHDYSVPILNANRFLAMIGYYNTTLVRY